MNRISEGDIITFLKEVFSLDIRSDQLSKPTTNFVLDIYTRFLNKFGDYGLDQPDLMACERLSRVHMMGDMIYVWNVFKLIRLYGNYYKYSVEISDIMKPKRQGTLEILSFLCKHYLQLSDIKVCIQFVIFFPIKKNCFTFIGILRRYFK